MQWSDINRLPSSRMLRQFAMLWIAFFGFLSWWHGFHADRTTLGMILLAVALIGGVVGLIKPLALQPIFVGWLIIVFPIGWLVSRVIMGLMFYGMFTPIALIFRLIGRDVMDRRLEPERPTYWTPKPTAASARSYFKQY